MKLRIVSDGTPHNTRFYDVETDKEVILDATYVHWYMDVDGRSKATITVLIDSVDIVSDTDVFKRRKRFNRSVDSTGDTEKLREDFGV